MTKGESEKALRSLCHEWRRLSGHSNTSEDQLSFASYIAWVRDHYPAYLKFRTTTSVEYDAELWFDQEFGQAARR